MGHTGALCRHPSLRRSEDRSDWETTEGRNTMCLPDLSCSFPHPRLPLFDADDSRILITQFTGRETSASLFYPCFHFGRKTFFKPSLRPTANSICQCKVSFSFLPCLPEAAERVLLDQMWLGQVPLPPFSITQRSLCSEARALATLVHCAPVWQVSVAAALATPLKVLTSAGPQWARTAGRLTAPPSPTSSGPRSGHLGALEPG